jgi:predicted Abi (CAAX) family protease
MVRPALLHEAKGCAPMLRIRLRGLRRAFATWPDARGWRWTLGIGVTYFAAAATLGVATNFLHIGPPAVGGWKLATLAAILFVKPCLFEEALYRGLLAPHPSESLTPARRLAMEGISLVVFVAAHPVNGLLFRPAARAAFTHPTFLTIVTLLGVACLATYRKTGSLWPAVFIHWATVVAWLPFLGGMRTLGGK